MIALPRALAGSLLLVSLSLAAGCGGDDTSGITGSTSSGSGGSGAAGGVGGMGGNAGSGGEGGCAPTAVTPVACADLTEPAAGGTWSYYAEDNAPTTLTMTSGGPSGTQVISVDTQSGFAFHVRWDAPAPIDASRANVLQLAIRSNNVNEWQVNAPIVVIEDASSARRTLAPLSQLFPRDGITWDLIEVPLAGGPGWDVSGDAIDLAAVKAIEIGTDTWDYGYTFDVDALSFKKSGEVCQASCPADCSGHGACDVAALRCVCDLGAVGTDCAVCGEGFVEQAGACKLVADGVFDTWPNAVSKTNGDPWLAVHHDEVRKLSPRLLVLHFPNPSDPAQATIVDDVIAGFSDGSRHHAYDDPSAEPQLDYQIAKLVDLRDGVNGHPPAPAGWPYENSTFYPRKDDNGTLVLDYAALFNSTFAALYGFPDPANPGSYLDLCALVDQGEINEVWLVASGDVASDASAYEVLEYKQRYTAEGNKIPGAFEPCAANGCFPADVVHCQRSVRIGFVNYTRGPGCYMHSQGHGVESAASHGTVPALTEWFIPFAGFDLDTKYGLPFPNLYALGCSTPPCVDFPTPTKAVFDHGGTIEERDPFDGVCGNVHFPPNGRSHYDYASDATVTSSCAGFGGNALACGSDQPAEVTSDLWAAYDAIHGDCGGGFLTWWYQSMPAHGSKQAFADGRAMKSVWPFLFY